MILPEIDMGIGGLEIGSSVTRFPGLVWVSVVWMIFLRFEIDWVFFSLRPSILCIMGELAGKGLRLWSLALVTSDR